MFQPNTVIYDRYLVVRLLGKGGFSQTYTVSDNGTLKVLKVLTENYPKAVHLFQREAKVLSQLDHPGIPSVDDDGYFTIPGNSQAEPIHCLVMELIPGTNLHEWLSDRNNEPIVAEQAINWLSQLVDILSKIHQHQCFHRDIKPSNIMLRPDGQLALIDFGAVREVTETYLQKCEDDITRTHVYSRGYTPIEQMQGRAVPESDFFALGRTFVHLMTGQNPLDFATDAHTGRLQWRNQAPHISNGLADLIDCLLAPFPGQRPHTPEDIHQALAEIQNNPDLDHTRKNTTVLSRLVQAQSDGLKSLPFESVETVTPDEATCNVTDNSTEHIITLNSKTAALRRPWMRNRRLSKTPQSQPKLMSIGGLPLMLFCSLLVAGGVIGLRYSGILQSYELKAFDRLLKARPQEEPDDRLLIVTIDEDDLNYQTEAGMVRQGSLSDEALVQLLDLITPHEPRVIGLDVYRDSIDEHTSSSGSHLMTNSFHANLGDYPNVIAVCSVGGGEQNYAEIPPPSTIPIERVGFSDLPLDIDGLVRRQIIGMDSAEHCATNFSFSYQLAAYYLAQAGFDASMNEERILSLGDRLFPALTNHSGAYHQTDNGGYMLMLNYRNIDPVAQTVPLKEILNGTLSEELDALVKSRIILIGTTASSFRDYHDTPLGQKAGVMIQGQMVSQILSVVLDERPLLWTLGGWFDACWIIGWSLVASGLSWFGRSRLALWGSLCGVLILLIGLSYSILLFGGWIPLVPSMMAVILSTMGMRVFQPLVGPIIDEFKH